MAGIEVSTLVTPILTLIGVFSGAWLHHFFSMSAEKSKQFQGLRVQSYVDYLRSVSRFAQAAKTDPDKRLQFLAEAADAKTRITIYGSREVVEMLAQFERSGANLGAEAGRSAFLLLVSRMRTESLPVEEAVSNNEIETIIFGIERQ